MFEQAGDLGYFHDDFQPNQMKKRISSKPNGDFVLRSRRVRNWPKAKLRKFKENLFQPVDALPLGIFRFLFGFLLCIEFFVVSRESFPEYYIKPLFHFTYPLFDLLGLEASVSAFSMADFRCPANLDCWYYAGSTYATMSYRLYFGIRIFLFHGELCLQQSLLSHFSALILDVPWPLRLCILVR